MPQKKLTSGMVDISIYASRENIGQQNNTNTLKNIQWLVNSNRSDHMYQPRWSITETNNMIEHKWLDLYFMRYSSTGILDIRQTGDSEARMDKHISCNTFAKTFQVVN
jgi:hypothetical protein